MSEGYRRTTGESAEQRSGASDPIVQNGRIAGCVGRNQAGLKVLPRRTKQCHGKTVASCQGDHRGGAQGSTHSQDTTDQHR
jgi:hypothetical protein